MGRSVADCPSKSQVPQDMEKERETLQAWKERVEQELDRVVAFWMEHSHDREHGGFFTCLGRDGRVYDDLKYVWLQGRQVWMYCHLYRKFERFHRPELLDSAKAGGEFLLRFARVTPPEKKCAFVLTRDGRPVKVQRTIFSECFYTMAMNELWRVTGEARYQSEAVEMMDEIVHWVREDPSGLGRPQLPGAPASESMAVPMMLLNLVDQLGESDEELAGKYAELGDWCVQRILRHVQRDGQAVLENVSEDGKELSGCLGRHQNPGHALEAGWFLLRHAIQNGVPELRDHVIDKFLLLPFRSGWDPDHGGLFYFQDVDGLCPTQLEWAMKLWWPHSEAMIAFLMGYSDSGDPTLLHLFYQVAEYTFRQCLILLQTGTALQNVETGKPLDFIFVQHAASRLRVLILEPCYLGSTWALTPGSRTVNAPSPGLLLLGGSRRRWLSLPIVIPVPRSLVRGVVWLSKPRGFGCPHHQGGSFQRLFPRAAVSRHMRGNVRRPAEPSRPDLGPRRPVPARDPLPPRRGIKLSLLHCPCARVCEAAGGYLPAGTVVRPARETAPARRQPLLRAPPADSPAPARPGLSAHWLSGCEGGSGGSHFRPVARPGVPRPFRPRPRYPRTQPQTRPRRPSVISEPGGS